MNLTSFDNFFFFIIKILLKILSSQFFEVNFKFSSIFSKFPTGSIINYSAWKEIMRSLQAINKKQTRKIKHLEQRIFKKPEFFSGRLWSLFLLLFIFCIIIFMFTAHFFINENISNNCQRLKPQNSVFFLASSLPHTQFFFIQF